MLAHGADLPLPARASTGSAGYDLRAAVDDDLVLRPGERGLVPTGMVLEIPPGWEGQIRPRSGLALRHGITLANAPATIDSDYRGEVGVILLNQGAENFTVRRADRIAQIVFAAVAEVAWIEVGVLEDSGRGEGGFGSSGSA